MGGINVGRWLGGGVAAGALIWLAEGAASVLYMADMEAALAAHDLSVELTAGTWAISVLVSLITGLALVFFYAAARPRFGPGPGTAALVAVVLWLSGYVLSILGYAMIDLYPTGMLAAWSVVGLVEMILASILGAWIYREDSGRPAAPPPAPEPEEARPAN